jgi:hypothetical protein
MAWGQPGQNSEIPSKNKTGMVSYVADSSYLRVRGKRIVFAGKPWKKVKILSFFNRKLKAKELGTCFNY